MNSTAQKIIFANVLVAYSLDQEFTYSFNEKQLIKIGSIVQISFRNKKYLGLVNSIFYETQINIKKIKPIEKVSTYSLSKKTIKFLDWVASYNLIPRGLVLKMILPNSDAYFKHDSEASITENSLIPNYLKLNETQSLALKKIEKSILQNDFITILLDGMP